MSLKLSHITTYLSEHFADDIHIANILKSKEYEGYTGYLLVQNEEERAKSLLQLNIFFVDNDFIAVTDYKHMIELNVNFHVRLNHHAVAENIILGWNNEDFVNGKITAKICFKFKP